MAALADYYREILKRQKKKENLVLGKPFDERPLLTLKRT